MQRIRSLHELPTAFEYAVIINCSTKWFTTLALASAAQYADMPIVLIDCASDDGSDAHFAHLSEQSGGEFYWLEWPLRPHGQALDQLFQEIPAQRVLLLDSDAEITCAAPIAQMRERLDEPGAYGAGFLHHGEWMQPPEHNLPRKRVYYAERMWIPCTLLNTQATQKALHQGNSFLATRQHRHFTQHPKLAQLYAYRLRLPIIKSLLHQDKPTAESAQADYIEYDTGALVHRALLQQEYRFAICEPQLWEQIRHYHGITRFTISRSIAKLARRMGLIAAQDKNSANNAELHTKARLAKLYPAIAKLYGLPPV